MNPKTFKVIAQATDAFRSALLAAPDLAYKFVRGELIRIGQRFKKKFIKDRMTGRPGINAPRLGNVKHKHVNAWVDGKNRQLGSLVLSAKIGRILKAHEEGRIIFPKKGRWLYIQKDNQIIARVSAVVIPARLGFKDAWQAMQPDARARIQREMVRAVKVAQKRTTEKIINLVS